MNFRPSSNAPSTNRGLVAGLAAAAVLVAAPATALGATWSESGDAGETVATAQAPTGNAALSSISGYLNTDGTDADMYKVCLDGSNFSAVAPRGVDGDESRLYDGTLTLVDENSTVVDFNDADPGNPDAPDDTLPAKAGQPPAGIYNLAITSWPRYPRQANDEAADDPGEVLDHFGDGNPFGGTYSINLTGAKTTDSKQIDGPLTPFLADNSARFKAGTTLEIRVKPRDCTGGLITGLKPKVNIVRTGNLPANTPKTPTTPVNTKAGDLGNVMRYSAQFGQYQLYHSTKKSSFNGGKDLTPGRYRVDVVDPAFPTPANKVARAFSIIP